MTEPPPEPIVRLRELDDALSRRDVSSEASSRIRQALQQRAMERRFRVRLHWWPMLAFAAGAAVMALGLLPARERSHPATEPERLADVRPPAPRLAPDTSARDRTLVPEHVTDDVVRGARRGPPEGSCAAFEAEPAILETGECVAGDGVRLHAQTTSHYDWTAEHLVLLSGEVLVEVESRAERPLEVRAGAATITVLGTRFILHEEHGEGWILMLDGRVEVVVGEQAAQELGAGQRLPWSAPAVPLPKRHHARLRTPPTSKTDEGLADLLEEVARLRRSGEYRAAVDRLRAGARSSWTPRAQQLVSYEIGTLLERQLGDFDAACEHWAEHRARHPNGLHASSIVRSIARMDCDAR